MKTKLYNPSALEIELAEILINMKDQINDQLKGNDITEVIVDTKKDNPDLVFKLLDNDGDKHEIVLKLIQRADK